MTAACLAPILAAGKRGPRESFDPATVTKKREGDLDLAKIGKNSKMPWEVDGEKWHTRDRVAHNGKPCVWDGRILAEILRRIEKLGDFAPVNWNARGVVEVIGRNKAAGWFLHAGTADEWLLGLRFRVARNAFKEETLAEELALTELDELDDVPVYGRQPRVRVRNAKAPWQEVVLSILKMEDIDTPGFQQFLKTAVKSHLDTANPKTLDLDELTPWKQLGRKWHVMRKGFLKGKIVWDAAVLEQLFALLDELWHDAEVDWGAKVLVNYRRGKNRLGCVVTKRPAGIDLELFVPAGTVTLGQIAHLGEDPAVKPHRDGVEIVGLKFTDVKQIASPKLRKFLATFARN